MDGCRHDQTGAGDSYRDFLCLLDYVGDCRPYRRVVSFPVSRLHCEEIRGHNDDLRKCNHWLLGWARPWKQTPVERPDGPKAKTPASLPGFRILVVRLNGRT